MGFWVELFFNLLSSEQVGKGTEDWSVLDSGKAATEGWRVLGCCCWGLGRKSLGVMEVMRGCVVVVLVKEDCCSSLLVPVRCTIWLRTFVGFCKLKTSMTIGVWSPGLVGEAWL